jgi:hypothetical protein
MSTKKAVKLKKKTSKRAYFILCHQGFLFKNINECTLIKVNNRRKSDQFKQKFHLKNNE